MLHLHKMHPLVKIRDDTETSPGTIHRTVLTYSNNVATNNGRT